MGFYWFFCGFVTALLPSKNVLTTFLRWIIMICTCLVRALSKAQEDGGIAQLARACGSYPQCRWFKSSCRYQAGADNHRPLSYGSHPGCIHALRNLRYPPSVFMHKRSRGETGQISGAQCLMELSAARDNDGPVVKRLRLRPFTAATRVRVPSGSPLKYYSKSSRILFSWGFCVDGETITY